MNISASPTSLAGAMPACRIGKFVIWRTISAVYIERMRGFHLQFYSLGSYKGVLDLLARGNLDEIPEEPGAFVLGTNDGTKFIYPWGSSPIFYIGQAANLRKRLLLQRNSAAQAAQDWSAKSWWPKYQYSAAFSGDCAWYCARGSQQASAVAANLLMDFREQYGAIPVANAVPPFRMINDL
jgi:hypothetical protein